MSETGFLNPHALWLLLLLPALAWILAGTERGIADLHQSFGRIAPHSGRARILLPLIFLLFLIVSISRPYHGRETVTVHGSGRDIFLLIDVSLSMLARDSSPSRMDVARRKAQDIVSFIQQHSPEDRIGLILFAGDAYVYCPLTPDVGVVREFLQNISPELISSRGSSLLRALTISRDALNESRARSPRLIIISDGEDLESEREQVRELMSQLKGEVLLLGTGTPEGAPIPLPEGGFLSSQGHTVITRLNEQELQELLHSASQKYRRMSLLDDDFAPFLEPRTSAELTAEEGHERDITTYGEFGPGLAALSLFLLVLMLLTRRTALLSLTLLLFLPFSTVSAQEVNPFNDSPAWQAQKEYERGNFEAAKSLFEEAVRLDPHDIKALQGLGSSSFRLGDFSAATKAFSQMEQSAESPARRFDGAYNQGNSLLAEKQYQKAIEAYDRALTTSPDETRAVANREIARALLKQEEEQKQQQSSEQQKSSEQNQDQQESQSQQSSEEQSSAEQSQQSSSQSSGENQTGQSSQQSEQKNSSSESETDSQQEQSSPQSSSDRSQGKESESSSSESSGAASSTPQNAQRDTSPGEGEKQQPLDQTPLSEREAREWLKALPESPLLMQRLNRQERKPPGGQLW